MTAVGGAGGPALLLVALAVAVWPAPAPRARLVALTAAGNRMPGGGRLPLPVPGSRAGRLVSPLAGVVAGLAAGPGPGLAVALAAATGMELWRRNRAAAEGAGRRDGWVLVLDEAVGAVRGGRTPREALERAASSAEGPIAAELGAAVAVAGLGGDPVRALAAGGDPVGRQVGAAWHLAQRHGVPAARVLERIRADLAEQHERSERVGASLAGPRATGMVLGALPPVGMAMGWGLGADPVGVLGSGLPGAALAVTGTGLLAAGLLWVDSLIARARR